ncbi:MAG: DnaA regulatory inactivator Hda [Gammaproteobacteria bacterium]
MNGRPTEPRQIPLPFSNFEQFHFDTYLPGLNREAVRQLHQAALGNGTKNIYLWGQAGTGKSHLLQAVCTFSSANQHHAAYIPLALEDELTPDLLQGLERLDLVCVDDLDRITAKTDWEQALFHLFNRMRDCQRPMIMAARQSPQGIAVVLPDLKSRLAWDLVYRLAPMDDQAVITALKQRARVRSFTLPDEVINYLYKRAARDTHSLFRLLDRLDDASLVAKKRITIPFVKQLLRLEE